MRREGTRWMVGRLVPTSRSTTMITMLARALVPAVVIAALLAACGFDQAADQDIFADADFSVADPADPANGSDGAVGGADETAEQVDETELTTPLVDAEPQSRPALRVNVDEDERDSSLDVADGTDDANGLVSHSVGDGSSRSVAAWTTQVTIGQRTMTSAPTTRATTSTTSTKSTMSNAASPVAEPTSTNAALAARATSSTAAAPTGPTTTAAPTTRRTTTSAPATTPGGRPGFPTSDVVRLSDGQTVTFRSQVAPGGTPVLAWLWAPG